MEANHCPGCGTDQVQKAGNNLFCKVCEVTYEITTDGAKVVNLDPLGDLKERMTQAEQTLAGMGQQPDLPPADQVPAADPEPTVEETIPVENDEDHNPDNARGFLSW